MNTQSRQKKVVMRSILSALAVLIALSMLRLGFWQLDRADQKREILSNQLAQSKLSAIDIDSLFLSQVKSDQQIAELRFRNVFAEGEFLNQHTIFIENQVVDSKAGYKVLTPFQTKQGLLLVDRGWMPVDFQVKGDLVVKSSEYLTNLSGRLNKPYAKPPLWDDSFPVNIGNRWQYVDMEQLSKQMGAELFPLMLELAPKSELSTSLIVQWQEIDDLWVAKHSAYAFQWFSMSFVFFIACLVLAFKSLRSDKD